MRSVEEQQARVMAAAVAPRPVRVPIAEAQGLMCAEEVITEQPLPGFDQAAIDGYAVRSVDVNDGPDGPDGEIVLPVTAVIEAGNRTPSRLQPKQAARVQTGAPMPTLAAAARDAGAEVSRIGIVSAVGSELRDVVESQLNRAEVVVIAGAVGGGAAENLRAVLSGLGDMEVTRIAMHPGSVQGFGQLGPEGVPTFLLPTNPVSALVVFEVMVRPLIRLSLGKRQAIRRVIRARTLKGIESVPGRKGFLRGQLLRDQDSGDYLVEAIGDAPGGSSHLLASLAEANCLVMVPSDVVEIEAGEFVDVAFLAQRG